MRNTFFTAGLLALALPALAACGGDAPPAETEESGVAGLEISNPRMVLNAVQGQPAAIYFDLAYTGDRNLALSSASVEGAGSAEIHNYSEFNGQLQMGESDRLPLSNGTTLTFEPGGLHVMALDPGASLAAGGTTELTLTVSGGDTQTVSVPIQAAGEDR